MAAFLHHCPYLKSVPKPALRRVGSALLSKAHQCPIIIRQISAADLSIAPTKPKADQRRMFAQAAPQVDVPAPQGCPFVASRIGMVQASREVQEDILKGKANRNRRHKPMGGGGRSTSKRVLLHRYDVLRPEGVKGPDPGGGAQHHPPPERQHG